MTTIVRKVQQEVPISIEVSGKDKLFMLAILQSAMLPRNRGNDDYNAFTRELEAAFRFELSKKD